MIQKSTILDTSDLIGVLKVNCFHVYRKKKRMFAGFGNFIKVSNRVVLSKNKKLKKKKFKSILVLLKFRINKIDGSHVFFKKNSCVLLKRRVIAVSKIITGCSVYSLRRKKFLTSFAKVVNCLILLN